MATAVAYGSITICDLNDVGEFSVQPTSDLPLSVVYDPDQNNYNPDWSTSKLRITPIIYYGGDNVALGTTGLKVTWKRREGIQGETDLITGENIVENGILEVTANMFTTNISMITYAVTAEYTEPTSQQTLVAKGQITFSLVKNASMTKTATITGESIFKYNSAQSLVGPSTITLTGKVNNVSIVEWQYQSSTSPVTWTKYPGSDTSPTLTVNESDNTFVNDRCVVRLMTSDNTVYDLHTITKLRDGAAGSATVSAVLTNDDQMIPELNTGTDYSAAVSRIIIYNGGDEDTANWTITLSASTGVTFSASKTVVNNDTVAVTNITTNSGTVTFTCKKSGEADIIKTFSVVKIPAGADGKSPTIYSLTADTYAINRTINNVLTPSGATFAAYEQTGGEAQKAYNGRFQIFENLTLAEYKEADPKPTPAYSSTTDEWTYTYKTISNSARSILCILFKAGSTTDIVDSQSVVITSDGKTGQQGPQGNKGDAAVNIILGNYADVLPCTHGNTLISNQTITVPFYAYEGTTRIPCTVTSVTMLGKTPTIVPATDSSDGSITWVLTAGTSVPLENDVVSLVFTATASTGSVQKVENYSWSRSTAAKDGVNSVLLQIFTPDGTNVFNQNTTAVNLQAQLLDGASNVTDTATYTWAKWSDGSYKTISGQTAKVLRVTSDMVDSYASFMCTAKYATKYYIAFFSVFDKTDPIQVTVISSVGTQLVNGMGFGALYVKVSRNGQEIDQMISEDFLTENPAIVPANKHYYKLDETNKSVTLMRYDGTEWKTESETYVGSYKWKWRDKDGKAITEVGTITLPTQGKCIYIDGTMVDGKIIADVEVTI